MSNKRPRIEKATTTSTMGATFADHFVRPQRTHVPNAFVPVLKPKSIIEFGDVVVTKQIVCSVFKDDYRLIRVDALEPLSGTRLIHASATVVENMNMFFETDERLIVEDVLGILDVPEITFLARSHSRFVALNTAPKPIPVIDYGIGAHVLLASDAWIQEETRLEMERAALDAVHKTSEWDKRSANPNTYPCIKLRKRDSKIPGGCDDAAPYCLGVIVGSSTKTTIDVRKLNRRIDSDTMLDSSTDVVRLISRKTIIKNFTLGVEFDVGRPVVTSPPIRADLRTLDVFAGCGGLSEGLRQSGYTREMWAIEMDKSASSSYQANFKNALVFNEDCNDLLMRAIRGDEFSGGGKRIPKPGEVDVVVGGPPCKSYSGLNRFPKTEKFNFSKSLVGTHLSYCDHYRPQLFLMENVQNFGNMDGGKVLRLCVTALLSIGYQVSYTVLQAGRLGAPQSRRRFIMIAVPLNRTLPDFPSETHTFTGRLSCASIKPGPCITFGSTNGSGIYRRVTVHDAVGDLYTMDGTYGSAPMNDYQRRMRSTNAPLTHHEIRVVTPIREARITAISKDVPGSDWRDLPNEIVTLRTGEKTKLLLLNESGGVNHEPNQLDTLIPFALIKTERKNRSWEGAYTRLYEPGHFQTTLTSPEPSRKSGTCIHPTLNRVASVREWARSQSFPDSFVFQGTMPQNYSAIGNAVSIAMARALGMEFMRTHSLKVGIQR